MYDKSLVIEILIQIENAINTTLKRFEVVDSVNYFTDTPEIRWYLYATHCNW